MVLILDGNLKIGAQVRSNLCHLICSMHLFSSRACRHNNSKSFSRKELIFFMRAQNVLTYHIMLLACMCRAHGIYIRWLLRTCCACIKENVLKKRKTDSLIRLAISPHTCAPISKLPSIIADPDHECLL